MLSIWTILVMSFHIGPSVGALIPVQDEGDPWRTSSYSELRRDTNSATSTLTGDPLHRAGYRSRLLKGIHLFHGSPYSGSWETVGFSSVFSGTRSVSIEAKKDISEELDAVWKGTFPGMYVSLGRDLQVGSNTMNLKAKFNIIDFDGLWVGITASYLF